MIYPTMIGVLGDLSAVLRGYCWGRRKIIIKYCIVYIEEYSARGSNSQASTKGVVKIQLLFC